jgi:hypothetical protein
MARQRVFGISIDILEVEGLADDLGHLSIDDIERAAGRAANVVTEKGYVDARARMNRGINLSDSYLQGKMAFVPARKQGTAMVATVEARGEHTNLGRFAARQLTQVVRWPNDRIPIGKKGPNPRKPGSFLPWKARIGDQSRSIPVGMKQAGISVEVTRGSRKPIPSAFTIGKRSTDGDLIVFTAVQPRSPGARSGKKGKIKAMTGPSVYQLFRAALDDKFLGDLAENLRGSVLALTGDELRKALG